MTISIYRVHVTHDKGKIRFKVAATSEPAARDVVMKAEGCPDNAITKVELVKKIY